MEAQLAGHETPHASSRSSLAIALATPGARAQSWPERPITMVVPAPPAGGTDLSPGSTPIS